MRLFYYIFATSLAWGSSLLVPVAFADDGMPLQCDNGHFLDDQNSFTQKYHHQSLAYGKHIDLPEHICGSVTRVFRSRHTRSGWHGYFLLSVGHSTSIQIVSNLDEMNAPLWPWVHVGDQIEAQGRYYYDAPSRQGLDWTHHGTSRNWPWSGFVQVNGHRYQ